MRASILASHFWTLSCDGTKEMPSLMKRVSTPRISSGLPQSSFFADTASGPRHTRTSLQNRGKQFRKGGIKEQEGLTLRSTAWYVRCRTRGLHQRSHLHTAVQGCEAASEPASEEAHLQCKACQSYVQRARQCCTPTNAVPTMYRRFRPKWEGGVLCNHDLPFKQVGNGR